MALGYGREADRGATVALRKLLPLEGAHTVLGGSRPMAVILSHPHATNFYLRANT